MGAYFSTIKIFFCSLIYGKNHNSNFTFKESEIYSEDINPYLDDPSNLEILQEKHHSDYLFDENNSLDKDRSSDEKRVTFENKKYYNEDSLIQDINYWLQMTNSPILEIFTKEKISLKQKGNLQRLAMESSFKCSFTENSIILHKNIY